MYWEERKKGNNKRNKHKFTKNLKNIKNETGDEETVEQAHRLDSSYVYMYINIYICMSYCHITLAPR